MNKEYTYIDGKVIISDEEGQKSQRKYSTNLDDILVQENVIEEIESRISELEDTIEEKEKYYGKRKPFIPILSIISGILILIGLPTFMNYLVGTHSIAIIVQIINLFSSNGMPAWFTITIFSLMFAMMVDMDIMLYSQNERGFKAIQGFKSELEFLTKQLEVEKEKLEALEREKANETENTEFRTVPVNDLEALKSLKRQLEIYFNLGYNRDRYYRYYKKGQLESKLDKYYYAPEIKQAVEYIEEKGPQLEMKPKNNRK